MARSLRTLILLFFGCLLGLTGCTPFVTFPDSHSSVTQGVIEAHYLKPLRREGVQVVQVGDFVRIIIPADDLFYYDATALRPRSYPILLNVTAFVKKYGREPIKVSAYTDNVANVARNIRISQRRAESVMAFLWSHGIPYDYLVARGYGSDWPISWNASTVGSAFNRRVEITFHANFGPPAPCDVVPVVVREGYG